MEGTTYKDFTFKVPTNVHLGVTYLLERVGVTPAEFFISLCNRMYERRAVLGSLDFIGEERAFSENEETQYDIISVCSDAVSFVYDKATNSFSPQKERQSFADDEAGDKE